MTTPLYPRFQKRIRDSFDQLIKDKVKPWVFFHSGKSMIVTKHDQSQISYEGTRFEGNPELVFWSRYIEPFMEDICIKEIDAAVKMATKRNVNTTLLLSEVQGLLLLGVLMTFSEMARIDRLLRGRGFPEKIPLRPTENEFQKMKSFIEVRIQSELKMWKPKSKLEAWYERYERYKFLVRLVGYVVELYAKFKG